MVVVDDGYFSSDGKRQVRKGPRPVPHGHDSLLIVAHEGEAADIYEVEPIRRLLDHGHTDVLQGAAARIVQEVARAHESCPGLRHHCAVLLRVRAPAERAQQLRLAASRERLPAAFHPELFQGNFEPALAHEVELVGGRWQVQRVVCLLLPELARREQEEDVLDLVRVLFQEVLRLLLGQLQKKTKFGPLDFTRRQSDDP